MRSGIRNIASREALTEYLLEEIMSGRLAVDNRLPAERELAQDFGLSRPIVREVLRGLHERGLITIIPARGAFVQAPTAAGGAKSLESLYRRSNATAREVMDARLMLETHAARLAAASAGPADIRALETCAEDCERADNVIDRARCDIAFHGLLARVSHNAVIETMFASITGLTFELMLRSHADADVAARGLPYHRQILDAVRAGDADAAESAMRAHLELAGDMYGEDYDRSVESVARRELHRFLGPQVSLEGLLSEVMRRLEAATDSPDGSHGVLST
jgi:GntR family transcriptional repressor for pyruvate dehydrogenase complex